MTIFGEKKSALHFDMYGEPPSSLTQYKIMLLIAYKMIHTPHILFKFQNNRFSPFRVGVTNSETVKRTLNQFRFTQNLKTNGAFSAKCGVCAQKNPKGHCGLSWGFSSGLPGKGKLKQVRNYKLDASGMQGFLDLLCRNIWVQDDAF